MSGYAAGATENPDYQSICTGMTGHAEVVQITFDPAIISYEDLITIFMTSHDPTTLNRQGGDKGTQYRSIILHHDDAQKTTAAEVIENLATTFPNPIVTQLEPLTIFYPAEINHQDYYNRNSSAGYCQVVIDPKVRKLRERYADKLKEEN